MNRAPIILAAALLVVGCGSSSSEGAAIITTTTLPGAITSTFSTTVATTSMPATSAAPVTEPFRGVEIDVGQGPVGPGNALLTNPDQRSLWLAAGGGEGGLPDAPEVYRIDLITQEVVGTVNLAGQVFLMDAADHAAWFVKWGDGAEPDALVARYDLEAGTLREANLGDAFSPDGIVATEDGLWMAQGGGWPAEVAFFDAEANELTRRFSLDGLTQLTDIAISDSARWDSAHNLWVSDWSFGVVQIDPETGVLLTQTELTGNPRSVGAASDLMWVMGLDGTTWAIDTDGEVVVEWAAPQPADRACCLLTDPLSDTVTMFYEDGSGYWVSQSGSPRLLFDAGQPFVAGIAQAGTGIWTTGEVLTRIELGQ